MNDGIMNNPTLLKSSNPPMGKRIVLPKASNLTKELTRSNITEVTNKFVEVRRYLEQLKNGIPAGDSHCIRMFPVWFSFRGNTAVHLSEGKSASILGRYFHDDDLLQIAREQLYWIFGKNPFGQSLMYGEGTCFPQQYGALNGEMVGSMPVGIETSGNDDMPFWPVENNATYKEVWTTSAGRFYQIAADLEAM